MLTELVLLMFLCFALASQGLAQQVDKNTSNREDSIWLPLDIINDIKSHKLYDADRKIFELNISASDVAKIVYLVYDSNISNFELLRNFSEASFYGPTSYTVLTTLWLSMKENGDMDVYYMMKIYDVLSTQLIHQEDMWSEIETKAEATREIMQNEIVTTAAEAIKAAVLDGNYRNNLDIQWLAQSLQILDDHISDCTMHKVVDELYSVLSIAEVINYMCSPKRVSQCIAVLVHIYDKLSKANNLDGATGMILANRLSRLQKNSYYGKISQFKKTEVARLINWLPTSVRNLYLSTKFCIRNVRYSEYLYSPYDDFRNDQNNRFVFTTAKANSNASWYKRKYTDKEFSFQFLSDSNKYEHLYIYNSNECKPFCHLAMTWIIGGGLGNASAWQIEPIDDNVYMRNLQFQEYLCASDKFHSEHMRYLSTIGDKYQNDNISCQWVIESC